MIEPRMIEGINKKYGAVYGAYKRGEWCVIGGDFSAAMVSGLNNGQAEAGMIRLVRATGGPQNKPGQVFPIDKLTFVHEGSDSDYETLSSGDQCIYYQGPGIRLATSMFNGSNISGGTALGTELYVNSTGWLDTAGGDGASTPIATLVLHEAVGTTTYFNGTALYSCNMIVIELL